MGGGSGGNFGNTTGKKKSFLDSLSDLLTLASLAPGVDTIADAVAIPVDMLRGDWLSVGFDLLGVIPFVGEVGDSAKLAKMADVVKGASRSNKGIRLLENVSNSKLKNTIKEMYRPGAKIGDGGLADAIRYEKKTGKLVKGKSHIQKGSERLRNLENILNKEKLTQKEKKIAEDLSKDLRKALEGK